MFLGASPSNATTSAEHATPGNSRPGGVSQLAHNALRGGLASRVGDLARIVPLARHQTRATHRAKIEFLGPLIDVAFASWSSRRRRRKSNRGIAQRTLGDISYTGSGGLGGTGDCTRPLPTKNDSRETSGPRIDRIPPTRPPWWRRQYRELKKNFFRPPGSVPLISLDQ
jgi:hypothetical protein